MEPASDGNSQPTKRPVGRPKGSKNKPRPDTVVTEKRPVGRPKGSKNKSKRSGTADKNAAQLGGEQPLGNDAALAEKTCADDAGPRNPIPPLPNPAVKGIDDSLGAAALPLGDDEADDFFSVGVNLTASSGPELQVNDPNPAGNAESSEEYPAEATLSGVPPLPSSGQPAFPVPEDIEDPNERQFFCEAGPDGNELHMVGALAFEVASPSLEQDTLACAEGNVATSPPRDVPPFPEDMPCQTNSGDIATSRPLAYMSTRHSEMSGSPDDIPAISAPSNDTSASCSGKTVAADVVEALSTADLDDEGDNYNFDTLNAGLNDIVGEFDDTDFSEEFQPLPDDDDSGLQPSSELNPPVPNLHAPPTEKSGSKKLRPTLPESLGSSYKDICLRLRKEIMTNPSRRPSCYDAGHFHIQDKAPFFAASHVFQLSPSIFYKPHFFVWLPHIFAKIPCPACKKAGRRNKHGHTVFLRLLGWPRAPRRVIDVEYNIYIVGYRYNCGHPDCGRTYQSTTPDILNVLAPPLAAQFSFHLTYRCGLTDRLAALLRASFQRGQGPHPFTEMIRTFHIRYFEVLEAQYLEWVKIRANSSITGLLKPHEHFSAWDDLTGYGGYVPSAGFFRAFYDNFVESHAHEIDQQMSMLSARILCIDHSHKVPKHLGKVGGEPVFGALHTTVNEYTEIRQMTFTPTKAHNQCMPPIANIPHSLRKYGHGDVEAIFTDSVTDKNELERVIPSLKHDVVPCPALSTCGGGGGGQV